MKLKIQVQHLQPGDIVGSGEKVIWSGQTVSTPKGKCSVVLEKYSNSDHEYRRNCHWGKYTMINVERK